MEWQNHLKLILGETALDILQKLFMIKTLNTLFGKDEKDDSY